VPKQDGVAVAGTTTGGAGMWQGGAGMWQGGADMWPGGAGMWPGAAGMWPGGAGMWPGAAGTTPDAAGMWPGAAALFRGTTKCHPSRSGEGLAPSATTSGTGNVSGKHTPSAVGYRRAIPTRPEESMGNLVMDAHQSRKALYIVDKSLAPSASTPTRQSNPSKKPGSSVAT